MRSTILDITALTGTGLVIYGTSLMHVPSAFIVSGIALLVVSVRGAKKWAS